MPPIAFTDLAQSLPATVPFVGPETQERMMERAFLARLGANESLFGPSPRAVQAMAQAARNVWMYGDPENHDLRHALAAHHGVQPENIVVGEGIDGLLGYLVRLLVGAGDHVVTSNGAYPTFNFHVAGFGGQLHRVDYSDDHEDPVALAHAANSTGAKLLYFANPDNPMGTWHGADVVQTLINDTPAGTVLVLDEAYIDTAPTGTAPAIDVTRENIIRMRTFSKAYGMAGLRVGYAIGHEALISAFHKVRNHFGVGRIQQAGALAALHDQAYLQATVQNIKTARAALADVGRKHGLSPLPSATNFVTFECGRDGDYARALLDKLIAKGIFVRMPAVPPMDRCIRVSVPDAPGLALFDAALGEILASGA